MIKKLTGKLVIVLLLLFVLKAGAAQVDSLFQPKDPGNIHIKWDTTTMRYVANGGYARMVELDDGTLLTVYAAANGNTEVVHSNDKGNSWSAPVIVAVKKEKVRMDAPDILLLNDGSILVCYNPRPSHNNTDTSQHFAISTVKSYDNGLTWKEDQLIYKAGYLFKNGCWEPSAVQLPSGEIQLFFSDEGPYTNSDEQNISMFRSSDNGKTWITKPQVVSFRNGSRDGMPVPVYLPTKDKVLFSIEDNGFDNFKPYIISSETHSRWKQAVTGNSGFRHYALSDSLNENIYAGAPYLRLLNNGNTILSYQSTQFRNGNHNVNNAEMVVTVGDADGLHFVNPTTPFKIPANATSLWNSITVLKEDTIIALTSTNAYEKHGVWMIKGKPE